MPPLEQINISAVAFKEGDAWVVQGIEYDIVAHAYEIAKLPHAFTRAVLENIVITKHLGRKPLQGIKEAPARFRDMYERAETELRPTHPDPTPAPQVVVRLAA